MRPASFGSKLYAGSRFNCIMPYATPSRAQLDLAQRHGIRVIYSIKDWYCGLRSCPSFIRSTKAEAQAVRQRVRQMRDYPAVLAWYLNDELGQEYLPRLEAHQRWVAEEDPQHPTWTVLFQVGEVGAYRRTFDIIGTDPYPIGRKPASMAARWTSQTFGQVERSRPMWQVPHAFNWAIGDGDRTLCSYVTRNNIFQVPSAANGRPESLFSISDRRQSGTNSFDYDLYNGQIRASAGSERHGIIGVPLYVQGAGFDRETMSGNFTLAPGSPGRDAGTALANFTDGCTGAAPDMGAHESGTPVMRFGVNAGRE